MMNIEADFSEIETKQVDLQRIVSDFVIDTCVLDAGMKSLEILRRGIATEHKEKERGENQNAKVDELYYRLFGSHSLCARWRKLFYHNLE